MDIYENLGGQCAMKFRIIYTIIMLNNEKNNWKLENQ